MSYIASFDRALLPPFHPIGQNDTGSSLFCRSGAWRPGKSRDKGPSAGWGRAESIREHITAYRYGSAFAV